VARWWLGASFAAYQRPGESVVRAATEWLRRRDQRPECRPFFLWVHLFDPHEPYDAPAPFGTLYDPGYRGPMDGTGDVFQAARSSHALADADVEHMRARYDGEVTYADRCLGALLDSLDALGRLDETLVAVTADHGEGMGEHGYYFEHGSRVWEPVLRVPLLLSGPGVPRGRIVPGRVRSVDLLPTLTELLGAPTPAAIDGASLVPLTAGAADERDAYAETQCGLQAMPVAESYRAFASGDWKLIVVASRDPADADRPPRVALYDLGADAGEERDLSGERPRAARDLLAAIARTVASGGADTLAALNTRAMDDETVAKLRALGYVQ
jgi:arylsulfatase A-like enzyme